jgi:site-specific DNA-methyltransferase (adenine-specific)
MQKNQLFCADNLDVLRHYIKDESVDLCYIDPPFNSNRNYNSVDKSAATAKRTSLRAFTDVWAWDDTAKQGFAEIKCNAAGLYTAPTRHLIMGLGNIIGQEGLFAYLISMTLRIAEIHRVLKPHGTFYLHCDPTSSHYLKLVADTVFCPQGGEMQNEIVWFYNSGGRKKTAFGKRHDLIFRYCKSGKCTFNEDELREPYSPNIRMPKSKLHYYHPQGKVLGDVWTIQIIAQNDKTERLGYPTQKPEVLLERIIKASSNAGDVVLDACCGSGTTVTVAQKLHRRWIAIDICKQSIALTLQRLENNYGKSVVEEIELHV